MKSDPGYTSDGRDLCRYRAEVKAYHLLHKYGVCKRGHVPSFHGSIDRLDPTHYSPHLDAFLHDEQYPSAILMEYLPNTQPLNCTNYSKERMEKAVAAIEDIHSAGVEQNDTYPKNILIVGGSVERVIFVDFDVAITYEIDNLTAKDIAYLKFETDVVKDLGELLVSFHLRSLHVRYKLKRHSKPIRRRDFLQTPSTIKIGAVASLSYQSSISLWDHALGSESLILPRIASVASFSFVSILMALNWPNKPVFFG